MCNILQRLFLQNQHVKCTALVLSISDWAQKSGEIWQTGLLAPMVFKRDPREDLTSVGASPLDLESRDDAKEEAELKAPTQLPGGRRVLIVLATATLILILFPFLELDPRYPDASKGLSVLLVTALFWVTEVMPLSVSSLLPMALYPLFGIVKASSLAGHFFSGASFLLIAGFF